MPKDNAARRDGLRSDRDVPPVAGSRSSVPRETVVPQTAEERDYALMMYREHAQLARQQETLRAAWSIATLVLIVGLTLLAFQPGPRLVPAILICVVALLGMVIGGKYQERYSLHLRLARTFRATLAETVRTELSDISFAARVRHNRDFRSAGRFVSPAIVWTLVYVAALVVGVDTVWRQVDDFAFVAATPDTSARDGVAQADKKQDLIDPSIGRGGAPSDPLAPSIAPTVTRSGGYPAVPRGGAPVTGRQFGPGSELP